MSDKITIGCDPEFGVLLSDSNVTEKIWSSMTEIRPRTTADQPFGLDGCERIFEIRPRPSKDPVQVVKNIRNLFHRQAVATPCILNVHKWKAGGIVDGEPIGGHIHFGAGDLETRRKIHDRIPNAMNKYLAPVVTLLENGPESIKRREYGDNYGSMTDNIRFPDHGGIEYRFPSSWLTCPAVAKGVLCLAKLIAEDVIENANSPFLNYPNEDTGVFYPLSEDSDYEAIETVDKPAIRKAYSHLWNTIKSRKGYKHYSRHLLFLNALIRNKKEWFMRPGMAESWGLKLNKQAKLMQRVDLKEMLTKFLGAANVTELQEL